MKRLVIFLLVASSVAAQTIPQNIENWPWGLTDPNTTNQVIGWDNSTKHFVWVTSASGGAVASDAIWDTKGDLAIGTGANTAAKLPIGTDNQVLTADSTVPTLGVKWATPTATVTPPLIFTITGLGAYSSTYAALGPAIALQLTNTTAATTGSRIQTSPNVRWSGLGWGTTASTSQSVEFRAYVAPVTGATPIGNWILDSSVNGASWVKQLNIDSTGLVAVDTLSAFNLKAIQRDNTGVDAIYGNRFTNTSPIGNFIHFTNASPFTTDLFTVDATGTMTAGSVPAARIDSGTVDPARLGSGTSITTKFLRGDSTWQTIAGGTTIINDTVWDTKGDLAVATTADTASKLAAGANDTMLMADSAQATGLKWGTPTTVKTALGLTIGTNVQAYDADLTTWAGITPGTGVGTALAVNVGSTGAFVTNGGALGTPSGGTLTNCTGLPVAGITASTSTALGVGSIELGHATDTTIARSGAGAITVEGVPVLEAAPRVTTSATGNTTPTPNCDTTDLYIATGMTVNMAFGAPTGTPAEGQKLIIRIKGTAARTLSFATGSSGNYRFSTDLPVPSTTITTTTLYMGFIWNATDSRWDNVSQMNNF